MKKWTSTLGGWLGRDLGLGAGAASAPEVSECKNGVLEASERKNGASGAGLTSERQSSERQISEAQNPAEHLTRSEGFLVFAHTGEVIQAEGLLRQAGFEVDVKGPPPALRTGCDMVVVFDLMREPLVRAVLEKHQLEPLQVVPVREALLAPVSLYQVRDYGPWFMVRAANMKVTVERATGRIVNVSGGGCPDVPFLAALLTGQCIGEAEEPRVKGKTLCSFALQHAFKEARTLWRG